MTANIIIYRKIKWQKKRRKTNFLFTVVVVAAIVGGSATVLRKKDYKTEIEMENKAKVYIQTYYDDDNDDGGEIEEKHNEKNSKT